MSGSNNKCSFDSTSLQELMAHCMALGYFKAIDAVAPALVVGPTINTLIRLNNIMTKNGIPFDSLDIYLEGAYNRLNEIKIIL